MTMLAGDEYAEGEKLRFKSKGGIATAWQLRQGTLPAANVNLASWVGVAGRLRTTHPALRGRGRERLHAREGDDRLLLAAARVPDDAAVIPLLVFNNLSRHDWTTARYDVGARVRERLDREAFYQVRDRVGFRSGPPVVAARARRGRGSSTRACPWACSPTRSRRWNSTRWAGRASSSASSQQPPVPTRPRLSRRGPDPRTRCCRRPARGSGRRWPGRRTARTA